MPVSAGFRAFVLDQLEELGEVSARAMFGGVGLYCAGDFFGLVANDVLYLRVDEGSRRDYERAKMGPFRPYADRLTTMRYYEVPVRVLESSTELTAWARKAVDVARRSPRAGARRRSDRGQT